MLVECDSSDYLILKFIEQFMYGHKGYIVGGCFKNIFNHEKVKDVDIFFRNQNDFENAINYFDSMTPNYNLDDKREELYFFHYENKNVKSYKHKKSGVVIELCQKVFGEPEEILNNFDFTIVKFAYFSQETKDKDKNGKEVNGLEYKILLHDKFFEHLHMKRLVTDEKIPYPASTFERMIRYIKYGYMPCRGTKIKILDSLRGLSTTDIILSESMYDGMD